MARGPIDSCEWLQRRLQKGCSLRVTGAYFLLVEGRTRGPLLRGRSHYQHQCERRICSCCWLSSSRGGRRSDHPPPGKVRDAVDLPHSRQGSSAPGGDRKSTRLNSSHGSISYAVFCL